jgi:hypothetical protein
MRTAPPAIVTTQGGAVCGLLSTAAGGGGGAGGTGGGTATTGGGGDRRYDGRGRLGSNLRLQVVDALLDLALVFRRDVGRADEVGLERMYRYGLITRELIRPGNDGQKLSLGAVEFVGVDKVVDSAPVIRLIEEALAEEEGAVRSFTV